MKNAIPLALLLALAGCGEEPLPPRAEPPAGEGAPAAAVDVDRAAFGERADERAAMVARQLEGRGVADARVLAALRRVPRHAFVPRAQRAAAYGDHPLPIGQGQTISQPFIVAAMTEALALAPQARVLEVGTGSGYQAAVLAELTPHVWTIEIVPELGARAAATLAALGYDTVRCRVGDGYRGWPEAAPFDAIVVTAAPGFVPPPLVEQLAPGGVLVLPVGGQDEVQELVRITKRADGTTAREQLGAVRFVPMTGEAQRGGG